MCLLFAQGVASQTATTASSDDELRERDQQQGGWGGWVGAGGEMEGGRNSAIGTKRSDHDIEVLP